MISIPNATNFLGHIPAHKIPNSDKQTNIMSVTSHQVEIVARNARQLVIGEKSLDWNSHTCGCIVSTVTSPTYQ